MHVRRTQETYFLLLEVYKNYCTEHSSLLYLHSRVPRPSALSHGSDFKYRLIILILHFYDYKPTSVFLLDWNVFRKVVYLVQYNELISTIHLQLVTFPVSTTCWCTTKPVWWMMSRRITLFIFMLPCIIIDFFLNNQQATPIIQIYSVIKLYMFRAPSVPIIRSFLLYIRHW